MLKTVSSITNAIGALNYKGTWNASTNTPTIVSSVGVKGDYYVVSVAGTTSINGISNWGVGDWITFNGSVWQRVEGGADLNGVNITFTGTTSGPTYETSNATAGLTITTNTVVADGTDTNIGITLTPKGTGDVTVTTGNVVVANGNGIDFSATPGTGTSELLNDYEQGTWEPAITSEGGDFGSVTYNADTGGYYIKIGRLVYLTGTVRWTALTVGGASGGVLIKDLPFTNADRSNGDNADAIGSVNTSTWNGTASVTPTNLYMNRNAASCYITSQGTGAIRTIVQTTDLGSTGNLQFAIVVYT